MTEQNSSRRKFDSIVENDNRQRTLAIKQVYDAQQFAHYAFKSDSNLLDWVRNRATLWDWTRVKQLEITCSILDSLSFPVDRPLALDIGCGGGRYSEALKERGFEAIGIDTAKTPLSQIANRIRDASFVLGSAVDLHFRPAVFDVVLCIELLHHLTEESLIRTIRQIEFVTKPEGVFVFDVKNRLNPYLWYSYRKHDRVEFTLKARTISHMCRLAAEHGFKILEKRPLLFPFAALAPFVIVHARKV